MFLFLSQLLLVLSAYIMLLALPPQFLISSPAQTACLMLALRLFLLSQYLFICRARLLHPIDIYIYCM